MLLEATSVGCPIVATPTGGTPDAVIHGVSGYLAADPAALAARLRDVLDAERRRQRMSQAARWLAAERFATPVVVGRMEGLYATLLEPT